MSYSMKTTHEPWEAGSGDIHLHVSKTHHLLISLSPVEIADFSPLIATFPEMVMHFPYTPSSLEPASHCVGEDLISMSLVLPSEMQMFRNRWQKKQAFS